MSTSSVNVARLRTRWSAIGAAIAVSLGAGGIGLANAAVDSGDKPITVTVESKRILDTRTNLGLAGRFADATPRDLQVTGLVDIDPSGQETVVPDGATGVLVNVTVVTPSDPGFLSLRPAGASGTPTTSTVNFTAGSIEPNAATVDLSSDGKIQVWVDTTSDSGNADVIVDVVGYTIDHNHDDRYYTESEVDTKLDTKANSADVYTKTEADAAHDAKADADDVYTKTEADAAHDAKADADDVYTKAEADAAHAAGADANAVHTGTIANDAFFRFVGNASFSLEDHCSDVDGCRVSVIREYGGTRYLYGPITFYQIQDGDFWTFAGGAAGSAAAGTSSDSTTQLILGNNTGSSFCYLSDWDSSGAGHTGDQNANFAGIHFNNTATVQECTIKIED